MQLQQYERLISMDRGYLSIGITQDGVPRGSIPVPWESTANAFNMRTPSIYIAPEDLEDPQLMELLESFRVRGMYIFVPLKDYSFISRFPGLWDIYIRHAEAMKDVRFMEPLEEWHMLMLEGPYLPDLNPLFGRHKERIPRHCLALINCIVGDIRSLHQEKRYLAELVIGMPKGSDQRQRWQNIRTGKFTYYEY